MPTFLAFLLVFNPLSQSEKSDPNGNYIRAYVTELAALKGKSIHNPEPEARKKFNYPKEMVKHDDARKKVIEAFKKATGKTDVKPEVKAEAKIKGKK